MMTTRHSRSRRRKRLLKLGLLLGVGSAVAVLGFKLALSGAQEKAIEASEAAVSTKSSDKVKVAAISNSSDNKTNDTSKQTNQSSNNNQDKKSTTKQEGKVVYLTFDDGPNALTGKILDVLKTHNVPATFFMVGSNLANQGYHDDVKRAVAEGHYVGAHSMTHDSKKLYTEKQFVPEMKQAIELIRDITGKNSTLVRPPYGSAPGLKAQDMRDQIVEAGIKLWDWTIDSNDWRLKNQPSKVVDTIKAQTQRDVEIVLMHEQKQTLDALPQIIEFYKSKGYAFAAYKEQEHFPVNFQKDDRL